MAVEFTDMADADQPGEATDVVADLRRLLPGVHVRRLFDLRLELLINTTAAAALAVEIEQGREAREQVARTVALLEDEATAQVIRDALSGVGPYVRQSDAWTVLAALRGLIDSKGGA